MSSLKTIGPWKEATDDLRKYIHNEIKLNKNRPESLKGWQWSKPKHDLPFRALCDFDVKIPSAENILVRKVPCAICQVEEKFNIGWIFWFGDGWLRTVGNDCAREYLPKDEVRSTIRKEIERSNWEQASAFMSRILIRIDNVVPEVNTHTVHNSLYQLTKFRGEFRELIPALYNLLTAAVWYDNSALKVVRQASEITQEARAVAGGKQSKHDERIIHVLRGGIVVDERIKLRVELDEAVAQLHTVKFKYKKSDFSEFRSRELNADLDKAAAAFKKLENIYDHIHAAQSFFTRENLLGICNWANDSEQEFLSGRFKPVPRGIGWSPRDKKDVQVSLASGFRAPKLPPLAKLKS